MTLAYSLQEGLAGLQRAKFASFASTSAIVVALTLIGVFALMGYHVERVTSWLRQEASEIEVFLTDRGEQLAPILQERITQQTGIASVEYISREQAAEIFIQEFGQEGDMFVQDPAPFLPPSFKINVEPSHANVDSIAVLSAWFHGLRGVDDVIYNQQVMAQIQQHLPFVTILALLIGLLVVLASLFLVGNTIRLTIYARRLLIRTMKLVGATDAFIRRPFVIEGMLQGLVGGIVACIAVWILHRIVVTLIPISDLRSWPGGTPLVSIVLLLLIGLLLGWLGSYIATQRFLKNVQIH